MFVAGIVRSAALTFVASFAKALFGAESDPLADVTQLINVPLLWVFVHPAGSVGAVTPSKFWVAPTTGFPIVRLKFTGACGPTELVKVSTTTRLLPHGVAAGTVNGTFLVTVWP